MACDAHGSAPCVDFHDQSRIQQRHQSLHIAGPQRRQKGVDHPPARCDVRIDCGRGAAHAPPRAAGELVHVRASQINGCGLCLDMHTKLMRKAGETDHRLFAVAAWRDTPYFSDAERAAQALAESVTRPQRSRRSRPRLRMERSGAPLR